jgi:uncharacterized protein
MKSSLVRAGFFFLAICALVPCFAWAWGNNLNLPPPAPVVDEYGLLSSDETAQLENLLRTAKQNSGVEISVFIPSTLRGREIEDFSIATTDQWKLGRKKEDKAFLITIAPKERKMRIEVGYGLEGELTDAFTRQVLDNTMRPFFREGRYYEGILATLVRLQEKVPLGLDANSAPQVDDRSYSGRPHVSLIFLLLLFLFIGLPILRFLSFLSGGRRRSYWGGGWGGGGFGGGGGWGSSGGSSWGGGGGGFGGGGSSSSW